MKKPALLRRVAAQKPLSKEIVELDALTPEAVRGVYVERFGPECSTWLLRDMDRRRRANNGRRVFCGQAKQPFCGSFSLTLPAEKELPPWLDIALSFLRKRRGWQVGTCEVLRKGALLKEWVVTRVPKDDAREVRA